MVYIKQRSMPQTLVSNMKNAWEYPLRAETYNRFYVDLSWKRLTRIWTLLETLTGFSKEWVSLED